MSLISAFSRWTRLRIASLPFSSMSLAYPSSRRLARSYCVTLGICSLIWVHCCSALWVRSRNDKLRDLHRIMTLGCSETHFGGAFQLVPGKALAFDGALHGLEQDD